VAGAAVGFEIDAAAGEKLDPGQFGFLSRDFQLIRKSRGSS
jgi:hypothetical protein